MRIRLVALASTVGVVAAIAPAHAAGPKPQITDAIGDANGVNQQFPGLGPEPPTVQTAPADLAGADISTVQFVTNFVTKKVKNKKVKVPNGFTVTMTLAAAPMADVEYRVAAAAGDCTSVFFEYDTSVGLGGSDVRCPATPPASDNNYGVTATASGTKISWVVPNGVFHNGTVFSSLNAQTRMVVGVVTAPQVDYATSNATYTLGK
ncbi:MAG: hypothetical protein QOD07_2106 [Frankiaceae bacterium]|jgi:hypothetical protein|nr:hypothetical protein [Frankiaceae bacterium]